MVIKLTFLETLCHLDVSHFKYSCNTIHKFLAVILSNSNIYIIYSRKPRALIYVLKQDIPIYTCQENQDAAWQCLQISAK